MDTETNTTRSEITHQLDELTRRSPRRMPRMSGWVLAALVAVTLAAVLFFRGGGSDTRYITQEVTKGDLIVTVTATGNLEPRNQVDIGSELSGTIRTVLVDVNDSVKAGQVLAVLDTSRLEAQVLQAESSLASAKARVLQAEAGLQEARANHARLLKVRELSDNRLPSQQDLDVSQAALARAEAELAAAKAAASQAQANLEAVRTDLGKAEIRSPINGVVLVRSVEPGQTVAASLQAPVLFTLAEDLRHMELHVAVDEADVGAVEVGQEATFTVDAFPDRRFSARITQVHFASSNMQSSSSSGGSVGGGSSATATGVVTYETVLEVDNQELLLRPGMTATAEIVTTNISDALLVPNAALRFTPPSKVENAGSRNPLNALMPRFRRRGNNQQTNERRGIGQVWILEDGEPALVLFRPGATDGRMTQVLELTGPPTLMRRGPAADEETLKRALERKLAPGMQVIVDAQVPQS
jgi:HlyD family secretion protein